MARAVGTLYIISGYLDGMQVEALRVDLQRVWSEIAGVKDALRHLADEEEDW